MVVAKTDQQAQQLPAEGSRRPQEGAGTGNNNSTVRWLCFWLGAVPILHQGISCFQIYSEIYCNRIVFLLLIYCSLLVASC